LNRVSGQYTFSLQKKLQFLPIGAIDEFESVLSLDSVEEHDYGIYVCEASNGAGRRKSSVEIRFQPKGEFCEFPLNFPLKFLLKSFQAFHKPLSLQNNFNPELTGFCWVGVQVLMEGRSKRWNWNLGL